MQPSLKDLLSGLGGEQSEERKFVDLFCGCGGASEGARLAGYKVVLAVDSWENAMSVHALNHPETTHLCVDLPVDYELPLPQAGEHWHLHGSPPCTRVSVANQQRDPVERQNAIQLVDWYIRFATGSTAVSWSMEQVATPIVLECLETFKKQFVTGTRFDYEVVDFYDFGVPQHRRRLIAGSADVVSRLRRIQAWHRSASEVICNPRGTHIRNWMRKSSPKPDPEGKVKWVYKHYGDDEACMPITGPSHVAVAGHPLRWVTPYSGQSPANLHPSEIALIQCFPGTYRLHNVTRVSVKCVGNALPPIIMYQMLRGKRPSSSILDEMKRKKARVMASPSSPCYKSDLHLAL